MCCARDQLQGIWYQFVSNIQAENREIIWGPCVQAERPPDRRYERNRENAQLKQTTEAKSQTLQVQSQAMLWG